MQSVNRIQCKSHEKQIYKCSASQNYFSGERQLNAESKHGTNQKNRDSRDTAQSQEQQAFRVGHGVP